MKPRALFFDLCGTIFVYGDLQAAWQDWLATFHAGLSDCGLDMPRDEFADLCDGFFSRPDAPAQHDGLTLYERNIRCFGEELGLALDAAQLRRVADTSVAAWFEHHWLDPDAVEVLQALSGQYPLALVSNFDHPPSVHHLLERHDLAGYFRSIVISADVGVRKPDPSIFEGTFREFGVQPQEVLHVGDSEDDVNAALAAGVTPILIARGDGHSAIVATDFRSDGSHPREPDLPVEGLVIIKCLSQVIAHALPGEPEPEGAFSRATD